MRDDEKGKKLVGVICIIYIAVDILVSIFAIIIGSFEITTPIRLVIEGVLLYAVYNGRNWARKLTSILALVGGIFGVIAGILLINAIPAVGIVLFLMSVIYLVLGGILLLNKNIKAYYGEL